MKLTEIFNFRKRYRLKDYKFSIVLMVAAVSAAGIFAVASASPSLKGKQLFGVLLGAVLMTIISLIDYKLALKLYWPIYALNILLLLAVKFFGSSAHGAKRWLDIGFIRFQPSDLTKLLMILFFAGFFSRKEGKISSAMTITEAAALILPSLYLIYKQPNLSNVICLAVLFCIIFYLAGLSYKVICAALAVFIPAVAILLTSAMFTEQNFLHGYQQKRILAWLEPEKYADAEAYQQINSVMAIGSGGLTGKGYNNDATTSLKNGNFISEPQSDFIFAIIGEELGFVGCCAVLILLLLIVIKCAMVGARAKDMGGKLICGGVAALIGTQTVINVSVATQLFPNTGISLPFVSYGLTSVVCFYMGIGFVLNVGLQHG